MKKMISFRNENENSAGNFNSVEIKWVRFYFSYQTCVCIKLREQFNGEYWFAIQNQRWATTGKHLNWFDGGDKKSRLTPEKFQEVYEEACRQIGI